MTFDFSTKVTWLCVTIRRLWVAQFLPECQLIFPFSPRSFIPKLVAQFHPEFLAQFVPELVAQFDPE